MEEKPKRRWLTSSVLTLLVAVMLLSVWWGLRTTNLREAHSGLAGEWVDDTGQDVSYQFREDGEFLIRQKLPSNLAPFSGDPGIKYRPFGKWTRSGQFVSVQTERHWGFELVLGDDGLLQGEYFFDQWSGQGTHSRTKRPVALRPQSDAP